MLAVFSKFPTIALKADGTKVPYEPGKGFKLASTGNWYIDISIPDVSQISVHYAWDASLAATSVNVQDSNLPDFKAFSATTHDPDPGVDIALNDEVAGNWITEDPSTAYVPSGSGYTVTNSTIAVTGGTANGTILNFGNMSSRRRRVKVVVTTAGFFRCSAHGVGA